MYIISEWAEKGEQGGNGGNVGNGRSNRTTPITITPTVNETTRWNCNASLCTVNNRQSSVANCIIERMERWLRHTNMALKRNGDYKQNENYVCYYFETLFFICRSSSRIECRVPNIPSAEMLSVKLFERETFCVVALFGFYCSISPSTEYSI